MKRSLGLAAIVAYVLTVVAANWAINRWGVVPVGFGLAAPAGVYFVGLAFTLRDVAQEALGRLWILAGIACGAGLSYLVTSQNAAVPVPGFPSPARLALASMLAFGFSELADFAVYTPLRERGWMRAVVASNAVGLVVDSILFLWLAFGSLTFLWGQIAGKALMTGAAVAVLALIADRRPVTA